MRSGDRRAAPAGGLQPPMVYFYWVCRDIQEFNSFKGLMLELADSQDKELSRAFQFNTYTTGEMDLSEFAKDGLVDNESYKQYSGRPNWNRVLKTIGSKHKNERVGVFMCGPGALAAAINGAVRRNNPKKGQAGTTFTFHKENF